MRHHPPVASYLLSFLTNARFLKKSISYMLGVIVNTVAIVVGSSIGAFFKHRVSQKISRFLETTLGYCTIVVGLKMALQFHNVLILILCVLLGGLLGTILDLEKRTDVLGGLLQRFVSADKESHFVTGFATCSIVFCVGGMAIVGSIQSGTSQTHEILFTKSILDGTFALSLASIYGLGTAFSAIPVFFYQGGMALLASKMERLQEAKALAEMTGVGGVLVLMIGINLSKISKIPVGNYLPAMLLVIAWMLLL